MLRLGLGALELLVGLAAIGGAVSFMRDGGGMPSVGGSQLGAMVALATGRRYARIGSIVAGLILVGWIVVQVILLRRYHPMQPAIFAIGCLTAALAYRLPRSPATSGSPR